MEVFLIVYFGESLLSNEMKVFLLENETELGNHSEKKY